MARRPFVVANWKMNHGRAIARSWCATLAELYRGRPWPEDIEAGVAPPFTSLDAVHGGLGSLPVRLGAQNLHQEPKGAYTGEIAAEMLVEAGCTFVIIGHSERRHVFGESDERISRKVAAAHHAGLLPLLCVGETEHERDGERTETVIAHQLRRGLETFTPKSGTDLVVAYEPVWAIGTGKVATPHQAEAAQRFLRDTLASIAGAEVAKTARVLYGGSVTPANAAELAAQPNIDGFLVGGASLDAASFHKIVLAAAAD